MSIVTRYAAPTPVTSTPSSHACGVRSGSCPMVRSKTHAAATDTVNCSQCTASAYHDGASFVP